MKTISEEQFKAQYGERGVAELNNVKNIRDSKSTMPSTAPKDPVVNRFTDAIGLGGAVDVFGSLLARQGLGVQTRAEGQEFVEQPTGKQIAGAVAQTAAIPAGFAITGGSSIAAQAGTAAGLQYIYDVGGSFAEGEGSFKPTAGMVVAAGVPVALRGFGAGIRGVGSLLKRGAEQAPVPTQITQPAADTVSDVVTPLKSTAREYAINRPSRLLRGAVEGVQEVRDIERIRQTAPAPVKQAIDAGLDFRYINAISDADDATKAGYRQIVEIAEEGSQKIGVRPRPEIVAGNAAADQYALIDAQRKTIGSQIGNAIDNLPAETYNARPLYDEVDNVLSINGITQRVENGRVILDFTGTDIPPKQRGVVQSLYDLLTETGDNITARQLYNKDRLLSQLQREARFDGVSDIMIKTPEGESVDMFRALREIFTAELEGVAPDIRPLNREYAQLRGLQDDIESSIFKSGNFQGTKDIDPAEFAQTNLRRLFSDAQSAADYRKIYDNLDAYSRALGYEGARADDLAAFATEMRKLYPENVPSTSATGIWGGTMDMVRSFSGAGKASLDDQQRALRTLLDIPEGYTPAQNAAELFGKKSLRTRAKEVLTDQRGSISTGDTAQSRLGNQAGSSIDTSILSPKGEQVVRKFLAHVDGSQKLTGDELRNVLADVQMIADDAGVAPKGNESNQVLADRLADKYQKQITNWENATN